jgi:stage IV sporulation protein FB
MIRFSLFGIPVHVQPFFWITLALIGGALRADSSEAILQLGLFILAGFISILVHELGHALTARRFGAYSEIILQAFGGLASYTGVHMTRTQSFLITAAGPAIQIALGLIVFLMLLTHGYIDPNKSPSLSWARELVMFREGMLSNLNPNMLYFLFTLMGISIFWAVINLLPVIPLDGGQMLNAILGPQRIRITLWVTIIAAMLAALLFYQFFGSYLFAIFLCFFAWQAWKGLQEIR